jgi:RNA polymerase sigma-70 factor (ECF subfamily)
MDDPAEIELLNQAKAGDRVAFERALKPHLPTLFGYSRAICGDYHVAQDVVQETALIAFRNLNHLFAETDFATWLRAIARRQALAARRKLARLGLGIVEEAVEAVYQDPSPAATASRRAALQKCLEALGGRLGQVIRGHYFQGSKLAELADAMAMKVNAVKQLLYRARLSLRDCIRERLRLEQMG